MRRHEKCKEHLARLEKVGGGDDQSSQSGVQSSSNGAGHSGGHSGGSGHGGGGHSGHSKQTPHLPPNLPTDAMSLSQAILMTSNGPAHLHETAGYASHFMAHLT